jgi:hypothetical protein
MPARVDNTLRMPQLEQITLSSARLQTSGQEVMFCGYLKAHIQQFVNL